jgi:hypothetical protein
MRKLVPLPILLGLALAVPAWAQTIPPDSAQPETGRKTLLSNVNESLQQWWRWSDSQMRGVFDLFLPDTQEKRTWRFTLDARLGDLFKHQHVRVPVGWIYGFNKRTEGSIELEPCLPNVFKDGSGSGFSNIRAGLKYAWQPKILGMKSAAIGTQATWPIDGSPIQFNDGVDRYSTYVTLARPSTRIKNLEQILNVSYDLVTPSSATGSIPPDEPQDDFFKIAIASLYRREHVTWGLTLSWAHTVDGPSADFFAITPSVVFDVPSRFTLKSPGRWQLGTAVETKFFDDTMDVSLRLRVRWLVDYRKALSEWRRNLRSSRNGSASPSAAAD